MPQLFPLVNTSAIDVPNNVCANDFQSWVFHEKPRRFDSAVDKINENNKISYVASILLSVEDIATFFFVGFIS